MKIIIPLAGRNPFFPADQFHFPLALTEIDGIPIIQLVVNNLSAAHPDAEFIFITLADECRTFSLDNVFRLVTDNKCQIVELKQPTQGALCSCLMAIEHFDNDEPIIIANSDQLFDLDLANVIEDFQSRNLDAGVISFETVHPRWSYIRVDDAENIVEATEKQVISRSGIAGFYYFAKGSDFVGAAMTAIRQGASVNGVYYIAPVLNQLILQGKQLGHYQIPNGLFHSFYLPQKIEEYERLLQKKALKFMPTKPSRDKVHPSVTVVIPMAGMGSRFAKAGYDKPKPFIDVFGKTMIEQVMDNLSFPGARYVLLARQEHIDKEPEVVAKLLQRPEVKIVPVEKLTEGTACTVLLARAEIDPESPLLIANCDQLVDFQCPDFIQDCWQRDLDGSILVFRDREMNPKWSFARTDENGIVSQVKEKEAISDLATVGIYLFSKGKDFVAGALDMIVNNDRVNNEFYTCPVYNYSIRNGKKIGVYEIEAKAMHGLGTPEDLQSYLAMGTCV
jgi:NDP-sugar pyrophosphorylase family protein